MTSIPTLTRRVTNSKELGGNNESISIHTLTRRVTQSNACPIRKCSNFNPHPHTEGDCLGKQTTAEALISIHTLTRRVTRVVYRFIALQCISIHTLTRRVTSIVVTVNHCPAISIHTLTRRVTLCKSYSDGHRRNFNPHPHTEGDSEPCVRPCGHKYFNPHPHTEGDFQDRFCLAATAKFQSTPSHGG